MWSGETLEYGPGRFHQDRQYRQVTGHDGPEAVVTSTCWPESRSWSVTRLESQQSAGGVVASGTSSESDSQEEAEWLQSERRRRLSWMQIAGGRMDAS
jgi:hypothetical protein